MARMNTKAVNPALDREHRVAGGEGAYAAKQTAEEKLRRMVMSCMLWESTFYTDGKSIADAIKETVKQVEPLKVAQLAAEARTVGKLRHVPLLLIREMVRYPTHRLYVAAAMEKCILRPDEITELATLYWADAKTKDGNRRMLPASFKKGYQAVFNRFNRYQFSKYKEDDKQVKMRDVLFMAHVKPVDEEHAALFKDITAGTLGLAGTWEEDLSAGKDKRETFEKHLRERTLGALALIRNLRNMIQADVDDNLIRSALTNINVSRVLPFRFLAAARHAPTFEKELDAAMLKCLDGIGKLPGKTAWLIDVSGSMDMAISRKSEVVRWDAAAGLAVIGREICESAVFYTFSNNAKVITGDHRGFRLRDAIANNQIHGGTDIASAVRAVDRQETYDRLIVITDEQSHTQVGQAKGKAYMVNVASEEYGVAYGEWVKVEGFSENTLRFIASLETGRMDGDAQETEASDGKA